MIAQFSAFFWRDLTEARSYRLAFVMQNVVAFVPLVTLFFLDRVFHDLEVGVISQYGGNYVTFALVGIVVTTYSAAALRSFSGSLRNAQVSGNLEVLLLTRANLETMLFGWSLYPFLRATLQSLAYLVAGYLILGLELGQANSAGVVLTLALTMATMVSLGIVAASFVLVFKRGDPFTAALVLGAGLFSGTMYPVTVLPNWLEYVAKAIPQTHTIEAMRQAILNSASLSDIAPQLLTLLGFALVSLPISIWIFRKAMTRAKREGSLAHY